MEKILKYSQVIMSLLNEFAAERTNSDDLEFETVFDTVRHHYQLVCLGWLNGDYVHQTPVHIDIKNGKIWIQKNTTEEVIAEILVSKGVPKSDIVLGLQPPEYRKYTEYAVA